MNHQSITKSPKCSLVKSAKASPLELKATFKRHENQDNSSVDNLVDFNLQEEGTSFDEQTSDNEASKSTAKVKIDIERIGRFMTAIRRKNIATKKPMSIRKAISKYTAKNYGGEDRKEPEKFLSLNLGLNEALTIAPFARDLQRSPNKISRSTGESLFSIDLQVIDLHWLFCLRTSNHTIEHLSCPEISLFDVWDCHSNRIISVLHN